MLELTVLVMVKIANLNEISMSIPASVSNETNKKSEIINIRIEMNILFISSIFKTESENLSFVIQIFFGCACEASSFIENLNIE